MTNDSCPASGGLAACLLAHAYNGRDGRGGRGERGWVDPGMHSQPSPDRIEDRVFVGCALAA